MVGWELISPKGDSDNDPAAMLLWLEKTDAVVTALIMGKTSPVMTDKHVLTISPTTALTGVRATKALAEATMDTAGARSYKVLTAGDEIAYVGVYAAVIEQRAFAISNVQSDDGWCIEA